MNPFYDAIIVLLSVILIILGIGLCILCKKKPIQSDEAAVPIPVPAKISAHAYSLADIDAATDGFSQQRIIGKGRLGTVYAAIFSTPDGQEVEIVVKRIHPWLVLSNNNSSFGFSTIVKSLSNAHHPNIVSILGFSEAPGERVILTEFVGMVNLEFFLHQNPDGPSILDWNRRIKIAAETARGLEYLHERMAPRIVHGCVKSSNILIDVKFCAKVCDYGLNFLAPRERRGLIGYVDDEYWVDRNGASKECDVYGFGVVLLELMSGRRCEEGLLVKWALPLIKDMKLNEVLDPRLAFPSDVSLYLRLAKICLACVGNSRKNRPRIGEVAAILNSMESHLSS